MFVDDDDDDVVSSICDDTKLGLHAEAATYYRAAAAAHGARQSHDSSADLLYEYGNALGICAG